MNSQQLNRYNILKLIKNGEIILPFIAILAGFILFIFVEISGAQENSNQENINIAPKEIAGQLKEIENSISLSEEQSKNLTEEMQKLTKDRTELTAALIASAQRVKLAEIEVSALEENLSTLLAQRQEIELRLAGTNSDISNLLAALQRVGLSPAPALLVNSSDALSSARSAMLLFAILPQLRSRSAIVSTDLQQLNIISQKAFDEEDMFRANLEILAKEQLRIGVLVEAREKEISKLDEQLTTRSDQRTDLTSKATSLENLINNFDEKNEQSAIEALTNSVQIPTTEKDIALAYANLSRQSPALPFENARGYLNIPAAGVIVSKFASNDGFGGKSKGISIVTRSDAQITAPIDGWIIYRGPYLNYGQIVIINGGDNYTILLAGLEKTNVKLNQFILRGEPIGVMGQRTIGYGVTTNAGNSRPTLYIEIRKQDIPFDPSDWWEDKSLISQNG